MGIKKTEHNVNAVPKPSMAAMLLISLIAGIFVPPAFMMAKIFLTVLPKTEDPTFSLLQIRGMLLGDGRMLLAFMAFFPIVGFVVQKYILWRDKMPLFTVKRPVPPVSD